jgi:hypothetical protein
MTQQITLLFGCVIELAPVEAGAKECHISIEVLRRSEDSTSDHIKQDAPRVSSPPD